MENNQTDHQRHEHENKIDVAISTTSGFYPTRGFEIVSIKQRVEIQLQKAAKELNLTDVSGWIAEVNGKQIHVEQSYEVNNLTGEVEIDWGPAKGGGGNA
jgi:hypothetical protein